MQSQGGQPEKRECRGGTGSECRGGTPDNHSRGPLTVCDVCARNNTARVRYVGQGVNVKKIQRTMCMRQSVRYVRTVRKCTGGRNLIDVQEDCINPYISYYNPKDYLSYKPSYNILTSMCC